MVMAAPAYPVPASWTNQELVVYHGTFDGNGQNIVNSVNVSMGRSRTDFGKGFYTTTDLPQARSWAYRLCRNQPGRMPVVVQLTVPRDELAKLDCVWFVRGDPNAEDYWCLVKHCRKGGAVHARALPKVWYDVAIGPLASTWQQRTCYSNCDQISFHSIEAQDVLNAATTTRFLIP